MKASGFIDLSPQERLGYVGINTLNTFTDVNINFAWCVLCQYQEQVTDFGIKNGKTSYGDSSFTRMAVYVEIDWDSYLDPFVRRGRIVVHHS